MPGDPDRARAHTLRHGHDTVAFQGLGSEFHSWFDDETDACVAYVDTGTAWVAAGSPQCSPADQARAASRFEAAARAAGRRASFFGVEHPEALGPEFGAILIGEQAEFEPSAWPATLARSRSLREQLRRARAKGVHIRRVDPAELVDGTELRSTVDTMAAGWLAARHLEPMGFLVALEPHVHATDRRYYLAEQAGRIVAFGSLVPIPARRGWLVEHLVRPSSPPAPNGTTELLLDAAIRDAADADVVSLGLAPLSGPVAWPLKLARAVTGPLYDFRSLRAFKQRMRPARWGAVWLVHRRRQRIVAILDTLRAFARGALVGFGARSLVRHPSGLPWLLAVPLIPWTLLLAGLTVAGAADLLGFSTAALAGWVAWDGVLAWLLFRTARHPRRGWLRGLAAAAAVDAAVSIAHVANVGLGDDTAATALRLAATIAPVVGTAALAWAASRAP